MVISSDHSSQVQKKSFGAAHSKFNKIGDNFLVRGFRFVQRFAPVTVCGRTVMWRMGVRLVRLGLRFVGLMCMVLGHMNTMAQSVMFMMRIRPVMLGLR